MKAMHKFLEVRKYLDFIFVQKNQFIYLFFLLYILKKKEKLIDLNVFLKTKIKYIKSWFYDQKKSFYYKE